MVSFTLNTFAISCLVAALLRTVRACDGFTNPTLPDLSVTWKMGEQVDIHWDVNDLSYVDLILRHWGSDFIATLLSKFSCRSSINQNQADVDPHRERHERRLNRLDGRSRRQRNNRDDRKEGELRSDHTGSGRDRSKHVRLGR